MASHSYILLFIYTAAAFFTGTFADWKDEITTILNDEGNKDFLNSIRKLETSFEKYNFDVDRAIPWKELKASMEALDLLRVNYNGNATSDLIEVQETTANLMNEYRLATNDMFRWAAGGRERFNFIVDNKDRINDMRRIKLFTEEVLKSGKSTIEQVVDKLNGISKKLILLESKLKRIKSTIETELAQHHAEFAKYESHRIEFNNNLEADRARAGAKLQECENRRRMAEEAMKKSDTLSWIISGITALVTAVMSFATGPIGTAIGLAVKGTAIDIQKKNMTPASVSCADISADFEKFKLTQPLPSRKEEEAILDEFYRALGRAIENAISNVTSVKTAIDDEVNYVELMYGTVDELYRRSILIGQQDIDIYDIFIFKDLRKLATSLDDYVKRHSGGFVFVNFQGNNNSRRRRRVLSPIAELELEYAELKENIDAHLNATENERNERFWILDNGGVQKESLLQVDRFVKFGM